jgi:hypothetical protein
MRFRRYTLTEITRCTTLVPTPRVRPIFRRPMPSALSSRMRASMEGFTGRRPSFVPFALARARPALTLSRTMPRSTLQTRRASGTSPCPQSSTCRAPADAGTDRRPCHEVPAGCRADPSAIGLGGRPGRDHVELFRVYRLEHGVEPRALVPALGATDAGILVNRSMCQPDRAATASSSRRWLSVSCFEVDTLR